MVDFHAVHVETGLQSRHGRGGPAAPFINALGLLYAFPMHSPCECTPLPQGVSTLEGKQCCWGGRKHGSLLVSRLLWLKRIMEISVFLSNFQLLQKLHFVSPEQLVAAKEGGNECSSAGKMGRDGDIQSSANQHSVQPPSVVTAHHNLFSGLHEQGSHFYIARFRSALQRKQAVGESVMQTQNVD